MNARSITPTEPAALESGNIHADGVAHKEDENSGGRDQFRRLGDGQILFAPALTPGLTPALSSSVLTVHVSVAEPRARTSQGEARPLVWVGGFE